MESDPKLIPAFPERQRDGIDSDGMRLLDYFAAAALTGILGGRVCGVDTIPAADVAAEAYRFADAMMLARSGGRP